jgi:DNA-binding transcriptional ArsR family regulator
MPDAARALDALGDTTRRAIVEQLASGPRSVGDLAERLPVSRPAVSQHLRRLTEAGLVMADARGTRRIYRLDPEGIAAVRSYLDEMWGDALSRFAMFAENTAAPTRTHEHSE